MCLMFMGLEPLNPITLGHEPVDLGRLDLQLSLGWMNLSRYETWSTQK